MVRAPLERHTVMIMGSISGVSPTATDNANNSASIQLCLVIPTIKKVVSTMMIMKRTMSHTNDCTPLSNAVAALTFVIFREIRPRTVASPVFTTSPRAVPLKTVEP